LEFSVTEIKEKLYGQGENRFANKEVILDLTIDHSILTEPPLRSIYLYLYFFSNKKEKIKFSPASKRDETPPKPNPPLFPKRTSDQPDQRVESPSLALSNHLACLHPPTCER
jgi:predicted AlkP superfamily pyrophosphatase or phosphodiesterase